MLASTESAAAWPIYGKTEKGSENAALLPHVGPLKSATTFLRVTLAKNFINKRSQVSILNMGTSELAPYHKRYQLYARHYTSKQICHQNVDASRRACTMCRQNVGAAIAHFQARTKPPK